jgi:hypothetical protein
MAEPHTSTNRTRWHYRREAAEALAARITRDATQLGEDLVLLSQCETDHEDVLRAIQRLVEELMLAQQLTLDFDCATRHASEGPDTAHAGKAA